MIRVSVLAPIKNEDAGFGDRVREWLAAVPSPDVELILLDNQSINGCCHGLPREVLIVRMETEQSPLGLWRHGRALAAETAALLWLPNLATYAPGQFRALIDAALLAVSSPEQSANRPHLSTLTRFLRAVTAPVLLMPIQRSRLEKWRRFPRVGRLALWLAERWLRLVTPLEASVTGTLPATPPQSARPTGPSLAGSRPPVTVHSQHSLPAHPLISVIITAHNEGDEVLMTVNSVQANTAVNHEIIVVDDASTDGSCNNLERPGVRVIRHLERVGVAYSRNAGTQAAVGDAFVYLDGHQRVEPGCLERCARVALEYGAITCPPCRPLHFPYPIGYGASFRLCPINGYFTAYTRPDRPRHEIVWISALRSPGYVIPRSIFDRVAWSRNLRGWGATDHALGVKCFFTDVDILHVNVGFTRHLFRSVIPYTTSWDSVWRNHALIARICFDERTWNRYWFPEVFQPHLSTTVVDELNSAAVVAEHHEFQRIKVRTDREFWRGLLRTAEPKVLN